MHLDAELFQKPISILLKETSKQENLAGIKYGCIISYRTLRRRIWGFGKV
jgi:hypothetical protein